MTNSPTFTPYIGQPVRVKKGHGRAVIRGTGTIDAIETPDGGLGALFIGVCAENGELFGFEATDLEPAECAQLPLWKDGA